MPSSAEHDGLQSLLDEQVSYYRARSNEYDEWFLRKGRYDRGPELNERWFAEVEEVRGRLAAVQAGLPRRHDVLELACGTGLWTERIVAKAQTLTAVDASPEVIALNRERLRDSGREGRIEYEVADLFGWKPARPYDLVFFGFWLSHVPRERFDDFWRLVGDALAPGGRVFFIDNLRNRASGDRQRVLSEPGSTRARRTLKDGREFEIVKVFYDADALEARLSELGWRIAVRATDSFFLHGAGGRA